jgi:hypothetical protein
MSHMGQTETFGPLRSMTAFPSTADIGRTHRDVCEMPKPVVSRRSNACVLGLGYSITSSARTRKVSEIVRPSAFAVLRLTVSSNFSAV